MTSDPAASAVTTADPNEATTAGDVVSAGPSPPPRRLAVYRLGEEPKSMVARLTLKPNDDGPDHVQIESDSEEYGSKVREIIERSAGEERDQSTDPAHRAEKQLRVWTRITDNLSAAGYGVEDISAGDYQLKFEINLQSGRHIAVQSGLHSFADSNEPLARRIVEAMADAFQRRMISRGTSMWRSPRAMQARSYQPFNTGRSPAPLACVPRQRCSMRLAASM